MTAQLTDPGLPRRFILNPELAMGEAYMDGTMIIGNDDLYGFMSLAILNFKTNGSPWWQRPILTMRHYIQRIGQFNPVARSQKNVAHHYDLSGALYDLFLDEDKQYSCGYFKTPDDTLEQAQAQKKAHIAKKLLLKPGMRVLDIGCGWGGMALTLAQDYGVQVLGVTLSQEQHKVACERAKAAGLEDQVEFRLCDYRHVDGQFDRIVSVGMFEHVGVPHYRQYFSNIHDRLTPDGIALIHTIGRCGPPDSTSPWITKYIFPGGYTPAQSEIMKALETEHLWTNDIEVWRLHYAQTLRIWRARFEENIDAVRALYDDRFCRMWRYYLVASELTFRLMDQVVFQLQISRKQDAVPLTRDYLYLMDAADTIRNAAE
ncbi:MAG: class I SAM-dependent methyltransferase [Marinosulfonomonas sp.]|nr:class I SAM-dependent methyltransferase [Marinosulfonomonas sp.]